MKQLGNLRRILVLLLTIAMLVVMAIPVSAATVTQDGVEITVTTDKEKYSANEKITPIVTVKNLNDFEVKNVSVECVVPNGYKVSGNKTFTVDTLKAKETTNVKLLTAVFSPSAVVTPSTGDDSQIFLWGAFMFLAAALLVGMAALYHRGNLKFLSIFLCIVMVVGMLPVGALAADVTRTATVTETVTVGTKKVDVTAKVTYTIPAQEEEKDPTTAPTTKPTTEATEGTTEATVKPSTEPTTKPSTEPTTKPTTEPTTAPTTGGDVETPDVDMPEDTATIYVAADAKAGEGDGSIENPYANIEEAKAAVRKIKAAGEYPEDGITVYFRGGQYLIDKTIVFGEEDSGVEGAPVVYSAYNGEKVSFVGGVDIDLSEFSLVTDPSVKSRLAEGMDSKVMQINLKDLGINDYGEMNVYGHSLYYFTFAGYDLPRDVAPELFFNGKAMTISRYPNGDDQVMVRSVVDEGDAVFNWYTSDTQFDESKWVPQEDLRGATFTVEKDVWTRMERWTQAKDMWVYGYWKVTWSDQSMPVESLDPKTGTIKTKYPSAYGIYSGKTFHFYNLLEEIDVPGEYYMDRSTGILYFYPPAQSGNVTMSLLLDTMVEMEEAHDIDLVGIEFKAGRGKGMEMKYSERINLIDCDVSLFADYGITMNSCLDTKISGSHLHDLGCGGINVNVDTNKEPYATMYKNLESMGIVVENCEIHNFSRIRQTYSPAVQTNGVGMIVRNNKIYDSTHMAIGAAGNNTLIENNEIFDVLQVASDGGVIYSGYAKHAMGIVIRNNYIHDIYSSVHDDIMVVYNDDTKDGVTVESNLFVNIGGSAFMINGGWDNNFRNNVLINVKGEGFVGCIGMDGRPRYDVATSSNYDELKRVYDWPAFQQYPHWNEKLAAILENNAPKYNEVKDNIIINVEKVAYASERPQWSEANILRDNTIEAGHAYDLAAVGFANIKNGDYEIVDGKVVVTNPDFTLSKDSVIYKKLPNFQSYDFSKIGLPGGTVEIPGPLGELGEEVSYDTVNANELVADEENWVASNGATVEFKNNTVVLSGPGDADGNSVISYEGQKYSNTVFTFNYKQENTGSSWGGFSIQSAPSAMPWLTNSVLVCLKEDKVELQYWLNGSRQAMYEESGSYLKDGREQEITFGVYDLDAEAGKVRVILSIDGVEVFNKVETNAALSGFEGYFTTIGGKDLTVTLGKEIIQLPEGVLVSEDFDNLDNWTVPDPGTKYSCGLNADGQLEIALNAGSTGDIIAKYKKAIDGTKKLAIEFDITVSGAAGSIFQAGVVLQNNSAYAVEASVKGNGFVTQWGSSLCTVADGTHKIKVITDPETKTIDVYLDGNLIKQGAAFLQNQTSWNTLYLFAKGNNSEKTLTAYFDNLTVTEVTAADEPTFETVDVNALVAEEDAWLKSTDATVEFKNETVVLSGPGDADGNSVVGYGDKKFKNTVFNFTYKQEDTGSNWGGFGIQLSPTALPWATKSVLICMKEDKVELQYWGDKHSGIIEKTGNYLKDGQEQEITFGVYDVDPEANEVQIVLSIDGVEIFNKVVVDETLSGFEGYFAIIRNKSTVATLGEEKEEIVPLPEGVLVSEDFDNLDNWTLPASGTNYTCGLNADEQLAIALNAGQTGDVIVKFKNAIDGTKKLAIEFDITVSGAADSIFQAGVVLQNGSAYAVEASVKGNGFVTQWGNSLCTVADGTHKIKVITDPETKTIDVYLDGNLIKQGAAFLQNQTSWNTLYLFAKGNNSGKTLTACFDNLTVTEVKPAPSEPEFETVDANALAADEANWLSSTGIAAEFKNGTVSVEGTTVDAAVSYEGKKYKNTVFTFTYKQEKNGESTNPWCGFGIQTAPSAMPWSTQSVLICLKPDKAELQYWAPSHGGIIEKAGTFLKMGEEQEITFGMYDVDPEANEVRIVLSVDGVEVFNELVVNEVLCGYEGYFTLIGSNTGMKATLGKEVIPEPVFETVDANALVADKENWLSSTGIAAEFKNGTVSVEGTTVDAAVSYEGKKYKNTVFTFTYKQEKNGESTNPWCGFGIQTAPSAMPWSTQSVLICLKPDKAELQYWAPSHGGIIEKAGTFLKMGEEQEITFGMYDVDTEANEVRIVLSVDGVEVFNELVVNEVLCGYEGYFTLIGSNTGMKATLGKEVIEIPENVLVSEDFDNLDNWTLPASGTNYTCEINADKQLAIALNAGQTGDVIVKFKNAIDGTKKLAIEFDITVSGAAGSIFQAGVVLQKGSAYAVEASVKGNGFVTQWGDSLCTVADGTHKIKVITDPETKTIDVYLDGNPIKQGAAFLQNQTSWNTLYLFAKGNNSGKTLTACFDNLTVTVVE